ncbi:MAG: PocR ligand-binding domain-containing protein [Faecalimonas sp.]|nr:PocR ligand-binding domain-containing protein [Faecalimonas sp.]
MLIRYNSEKLQEMVRDFYNVTQIQILVLDTDLKPITMPTGTPHAFCSRIQAFDCGLEKCLACDRELLERCLRENKPVVHICHAGLFDMATPLLHPQDNIVVGYLLMGRCRQNADFRQVAEFLSAFPGSYEDWEKDYLDLPYYTAENIESAARLAAAMSVSIIQENMIWLELNELADAAAAFIREHLSEDLSLTSLCQTLHVNKNLLYDSFHTHYHCTVNEYITKERMKKAKSLLKNSTLPVSQICEELGLKTPAYFIKRFREQTGITPLAYRKKNQKTQNGT